MNAVTKAHLALLGTNLFFALNYSAIKYFTNNHIAGPFGINILRVGGSMLLFWLLFPFKPNKKVFKLKDIKRLLLCAFTAIAANQMLFIKGLQYTSPLHASLLTLLSPILITLLASYMLKERLSILKVGGLLFALSGALLLLSGKETNPGDNFLLGDSLIMASSVAYTFYFILVKPLMDDYSPMMVTRMIFSFGFIMILPLCVQEVRAINFKDFSPSEWLSMFYVVVPGTFLAYVFNVYGIKILDASKAGAYIYTQPVFAGAAAAFFLGEKITLPRIIAALMIFAGLYMAQRKQKKLNSIPSAEN